jgi:hypothetical protein
MKRARDESAIYTNHRKKWYYSGEGVLVGGAEEE